ncbi:hypothetical protein Pcinc_041424 [Petrolisthes cinctipes]|uniref:Uncharacterized protein n=1 Tax=Petrolisthes cinctipes TaxID=88211 RepID=A0AAE1EHT6_PETCI|nr:hypothetical protein Pcinc_041424 [Petrolisthes cinctipes]
MLDLPPPRVKQLATPLTCSPSHLITPLTAHLRQVTTPLTTHHTSHSSSHLTTPLTAHLTSPHLSQFILPHHTFHNSPHLSQFTTIRTGHLSHLTSPSSPLVQVTSKYYSSHNSQLTTNKCHLNIPHLSQLTTSTGHLSIPHLSHLTSPIRVEPHRRYRRSQYLSPQP